MSPTSIGGGYRIGVQAVSISPARMHGRAANAGHLRPASLKLRCSKEIFYKRKISFELGRYKV